MTNIVAPFTQSNPQLRAFAILAQIARTRRQVYCWLALGFYPPDDKLVSALNSRQVLNEITTATAWLGQDQMRLQNGLAGLEPQPVHSLDSLSKEFTRLFCKSAERISMRESTYRWREASTVLESANDMVHSLRQQYGQFGLVPAQNQDDTLAVELEFIAFLCEREADEWGRQSSETARQLRRHERAFLEDHLARWYPEFCWRITEQAQDSFYSKWAQLVDVWLKLECGPGYTAVR